MFTKLKIMQRLCFVFLLVMLFGSVRGQSVVLNQENPKYEVRAVWLTTIGGIDWPHSYSQSKYSAEKQKQELRNILDRLKEANINTVLLQTRVRGTMIYPSLYEPWDGCLSGFPGKSPGYDALQFAIEECHKRGMELHAWVVTIPMGKWDALGCKSLRKKFPGLVRKIGSDGFMNPEDARTGDYLANICREITQNYQVDGIHLDYIRYPETWNIKVSRENGRAYITDIVRKIHDAVKAVKPWVKMSCSPIGKYDDLARYWSHGWNAYTKVCQDAQGWLKSGYMDELFPMMYFRNEQFYPFAIDWAEQSDGNIVVPGLGIYFLDPKEGKWSLDDVTGEMFHLRNLGMGHAFFRTKFFLDNQKGILDFTKNEFNLYPSLVPPMTWECDKRPLPPSRLDLKVEEGKIVLSWTNVARYEDGSEVLTPYIYNNVYVSHTFPVDITDARNLVCARKLGETLVVQREETDAPLYFAVTSMDGYGNESKEVQSHREKMQELGTGLGKARRLQCDGNTVKVPIDEKICDFSYLLVETLQGQVVLVGNNDDKMLNVRNLKGGVYVLKTVNKKGVTHTLGTFLNKKF